MNSLTISPHFILRLMQTGNTKHTTAVLANDPPKMIDSIPTLSSIQDSNSHNGKKKVLNKHKHNKEEEKKKLSAKDLSLEL